MGKHGTKTLAHHRQAAAEEQICQLGGFIQNLTLNNYCRSLKRMTSRRTFPVPCLSGEGCGLFPSLGCLAQKGFPVTLQDTHEPAQLLSACWHEGNAWAGGLSTCLSTASPWCSQEILRPPPTLTMVWVPCTVELWHAELCVSTPGHR